MVLLVVVVQLFATPCTAARQAFPSLTISQSLPMLMFMASVMPSSHFILWFPLLLPSIVPSIRTFPMSHLCTSYDQNTGASASASVLPVSIKGWSPLRLTGWSPCCPRDFQESSPAPQFEGINSLAFFLLYGPALKTVRDHWEDHSLDYLDLCWQSNVSAFQHTV